MWIELFQDNYEKDQETQEAEESLKVEGNWMYEISEELSNEAKAMEQQVVINETKDDLRHMPLDQDLMYWGHYDPEGNFENESDLA